jgi:RNA polymerase sigma-70 factor (ECF subfamily)
VLRLQDARDEAAWSEFLLLYEPLILKLIRRGGVSESDAQDVCQQVLSAVACDVGQWKSDEKQASFRRWLFRIARNRVIKFMTKERARIVAEGGTDARNRLQSIAEWQLSPAEVFEREYRQQIILVAGEQIRGEFQQSTWLAFWRTCVEGQSVADVAAELNTTTGNVYVARSRIIARLRQKIHELEGTA